jgi:hypothetical protein
MRRRGLSILRWQHMLRCPVHGPADPVMQQVLFVLSTHFNKKQDWRAWPSIRKLAEECRRSERTTWGRVDAAVAGGWLERRPNGRRSKSNAVFGGMSYWPALPPGSKNDAPVAGVTTGESQPKCNCGLRPVATSAAAVVTDDTRLSQSQPHNNKENRSKNIENLRLALTGKQPPEQDHTSTHLEGEPSEPRKTTTAV